MKLGLGTALLLSLVMILGASSLSRTRAAAQDASSGIRAVLEEQAAAWNRGDIEGFVQGYWKSENLTFAGSSGVTRGWQGLLERYRRSYPDRKAMGQLTFSELEITPLGADAALVLGRWQLQREADRPGGIFTLVMRRLPDGCGNNSSKCEGWRIIHDHTSSFPATP